MHSLLLLVLAVVCFVAAQEKDEYGNEITRLARPLPVEYLLLDLPAAFPVEPIFTFYAGDSQKPFSIENRAEIGEMQVRLFPLNDMYHVLIIYG